MQSNFSNVADLINTHLKYVCQFSLKHKINFNLNTPTHMSPYFCVQCLHATLS